MKSSTSRAGGPLTVGCERGKEAQATDFVGVFEMFAGGNLGVAHRLTTPPAGAERLAMRLFAALRGIGGRGIR